MDSVSLVLLNPAQTLKVGWKQGRPPLPGPQMFSEHPTAMVVVVEIVVAFVSGFDGVAGSSVVVVVTSQRM